MRRALIPIGVTFAVQTFSSVANLALATMMPAVAPTVGVDARLIGAFTAIIYGASMVSSFSSANIIARWGTVRILQLCLLVDALGLLTLTLATPWTLVLGVTLIGLAAGPLNPASAHILSRRVSSAWYSTVFTVKQTGVPVGFALAGVVVPLLAGLGGWQVAAWTVAGAVAGLAMLLQLLYRELESDAPVTARTSLWQPLRHVFAHRQLRALAVSSLLFVVGQHTFTFVLVTYLVEWCGLSLRDAGLILSASQIGAATVRIALGVTADLLRERFVLLGIVGVLIAAGAFATGSIQPDWPRGAVIAAAMLFGISGATWNGVSFAEFVRWAPAGQSGAISGASTAIIFAGAVIGPASFSALVSATGDYRAGFIMVFVATLTGGVWLLVEGWRLRRGLSSVGGRSIRR